MLSGSILARSELRRTFFFGPQIWRQGTRLRAVMYVGTTEELERIKDQSTSTGEREPRGEDDRAPPDLEIGRGNRRARPQGPDGER